MGGPLALSLSVALFVLVFTLFSFSPFAALGLLVAFVLLIVGGVFSVVGSQSAGRAKGDQDPTSRWWVGALGALGTGGVLALLFTFSAPADLFFWSHPLALPLLFSLPAIVGYLLLVRGAETVVVEASAVGIALGWVLFMGFASSVFFVSPFLAILLWPFLAVLFLWAVQKIAATLATRYLTRYLPS